MKNYTQDTDLKLWYPMTIGSGTAVSDYKANANMTLLNSPTWRKQNNMGGHCLQFNGSNQYATAGTSQFAPDKGGAFTFLIWVYDTGTTNYTMFANLVNNGNGIFLQHTRNTAYTGFKFLGCGHRSTPLTEAVRFRVDDLDNYANTWAFYAYRYNGGTLNDTASYDAFINLQKQTIKSVVAAGNNPQNNSFFADVNIGSPLAGAYFNGIADNMMFFTRALTQEEIKDIYNKTYRR